MRVRCHCDDCVEDTGMTLVRRAIDDFRANPFAHGAILMFPFVQYGLNYFVSIEAVLCIAIIYQTRLRINVLPTAVAAIAISLSLLWCALYLPEEPLWSRELRLGVDLVLLFWLLEGSPRHDVTKINGNWALAMLAICAVFAAIQNVAGRKGIALYMPTSFFVNHDDNVLAASWVKLARDHGFAFEIRPSAFYSEPSYLGVMSLVMNFICLHTLSGRRRILASILALTACAAAQTMYGMVSNLLITMAFHHRRIDKMVLLSVAACALALVAMPLFAVEPGRLERILSGHDESTGLRVTQPLELVGYILAHHPFGVPLTAAKELFEQRGLIERWEDAPFHNGVLNLLYAYGWIGFAVVILLFVATGSPICALFMFLVMCQNGAELDFDKMFLMTFGIHIARGMTQHARYVKAHFGTPVARAT
jgi:hypothetical protein